MEESPPACNVFVKMGTQSIVHQVFTVLGKAAARLLVICVSTVRCQRMLSLLTRPERYWYFRGKKVHSLPDHCLYWLVSMIQAQAIQGMAKCQLVCTGEPSKEATMMACRARDFHVPKGRAATISFGAGFQMPALSRAGRVYCASQHAAAEESHDPSDVQVTSWSAPVA